jgi:hypothetical protein
MPATTNTYGASSLHTKHGRHYHDIAPFCSLHFVLHKSLILLSWHGCLCSFTLSHFYITIYSFDVFLSLLPFPSGILPCSPNCRQLTGHQLGFDSRQHTNHFPAFSSPRLLDFITRMIFGEEDIHCSEPNLSRFLLTTSARLRFVLSVRQTCLSSTFSAHSQSHYEMQSKKQKTFH